MEARTGKSSEFLLYALIKTSAYELDSTAVALYARSQAYSTPSRRARAIQLWLMFAVATGSPQLVEADVHELVASMPAAAVPGLIWPALVLEGALPQSLLALRDKYRFDVCSLASSKRVEYDWIFM